MVEFSREYSKSTEFVVEGGDFSSLEIRCGSDENQGFHYFYDTASKRLVTDFVIDDRPRVATLCQVTLIKKESGYSPRIRLWKKDKKKPGRTPVEHTVTEDDITKIIKASVDTGEAYRNFWQVIHFLQSFAEVDIPDNNFRVVTSNVIELAELLETKDKRTILAAVKIAVGSDLTDEDVRLLSNRKVQFQEFQQLLVDDDYFDRQKSTQPRRRPEDVWQDFFERNPWIFGYGLNLIACESLDEHKLEQITTGADIFRGAGKRSDAVLRSKGYISSLTFCEIKTHRTQLLTGPPYRPPDVYQISKELSGGLSQVQKTTAKAMQRMVAELTQMFEDDGTPLPIQVSTVRPRQVLVIGNLSEFAQTHGVNRERWSAFELFRRGVMDVEIVTFDELYERARFIVEDR